MAKKGVSGMDSLPLEGVRIVDFTWVLAGPLCTQMLAAMGADVVKIESSRRLDEARTREPFADRIPGPNRSGPFNSINPCKKSCTLNLTKPEAVELARRLIKLSDVVIDNFAFGVMERLGLGHEVLMKLKPDLIVVSCTGLGATGPRRHYVAFGTILHAFAGLTGLIGYPGGSPKAMGGPYTDPLTGIGAAFAILAALHHRAESGQGQFIDISMAEATIAQLPEAIMDYTMNGRIRGREGNRDDIMAPHDAYPCRGGDRWVCIAVTNEEEWQSLCRAMGTPSWTNDARFSDMFSRRRNLKELDELISAWTSSRTSYEVMHILQEAGVPAGPSSTLKDMVTDPHLNERGYFFELDHPETGRRIVSGLPWKLGNHPKLEYQPAPVLGQHNSYVFEELLGLTEEQVAALMANGIAS
ncbi:MAG: CoA transferase [Chloroflexota bacterium]